MPDKKNKIKPKKFGRYSREFVEVACPTCKQHKIICIPEESIPNCEYCKRPMVLREILTEGKY